MQRIGAVDSVRSSYCHASRCMVAAIKLHEGMKYYSELFKSS